MAVAALVADPVVRPVERDRFELLVAIGLAAFVAASHLEAAVGAAPYSPLLSIALVVVGLGAGAWAVGVARKPSPGMLLAGAAGAVALVALWAWTRAIGVPFAVGRAPVGVLDAVTAFDELLLAGFALAGARASRHAGRIRPRRRRGELASIVGSVAISLSFILLAMGCDPARSAADGTAAGGQPPALICHLY